MPSKKPTQAPTLDAGNMVKGGTSASQKFPDWKQWVEGSAEFDGTGLRDVVNSNALMLDAVKGDLDASAQAILELRRDVQVLKEAPAPRPFRRGVFVAWMFANGQFTPRQFALHAAAEGYEWAALELDDYQNRDRWPEFREACEAQGVIPGVWVTEGGNLWMTPSDAGLAIAEMEGPGDYEGIINVINGVGAGPLPTCPLAIVTNFNTPLTTRAAAEPLIAAGFACLTEAYLNENANANPDGLDQYARSLGWGSSQPVFGVYSVGGHPVPSYEQWADWPGADYLGEYVL